MSEENQQDEDTNDNVVSINPDAPINLFRGLGLGQLGSYRDYTKVLANSVNEISNLREIWNYVNSPNDVAANLHLMVSYALESSADDVNTGNPEMHNDIEGFAVTEVNFATIILNILDLGVQQNLRIPETILAIYEHRVKAVNEEIKIANAEAQGD